MSTITARTAEPQETRGLSTRAATAVMATVALVLGGTFFAPAFAVDDTSTSINAGFASLTTLVVGVLATALFGITVATLGIKMGVRWLKKGAAS